MKYTMLYGVLIAASVTNQVIAQESTRSVSVPNQQKYWADVIAAIDRFKKEGVVTAASAYTGDLQGIVRRCFIDATITELIARALYMREMLDLAQLSKKLNKMLENLESNTALTQELRRLGTENINPYWFVGRRTTIADIIGTEGQLLIAAAALNDMVLKQLQRVRDLLIFEIGAADFKQSELEKTKPVVVPATPGLKEKVTTVVQALQEGPEAKTEQPLSAEEKRMVLIMRKEGLQALLVLINEMMSMHEQTKKQLMRSGDAFNNTAVTQYLKNLTSSIRFLLDDDYLTEMETITNLARTLYLK